MRAVGRRASVAGMRSTLIAICLSVLPAGAQERPPYLGTLQAEDRNTALFYSCPYDVNGNIECDFSEARLEPAYTADEIEAESARMLAEMPPDREMCEVYETMRPLMANPDDPLIQGTDEGVLAKNLSLVDRLLGICETGDRGDVDDYVEAFAEDMRTTCSLRATLWEATFTPGGAGVWFVNRSPPGGCGVVDAHRWTQEDDAWILTWNRIVTNRDAGPGCQALEDGVVQYRPGPRQHAIECRIVEMGPP